MTSHLPLTTSSSDSEDQWNSHSFKNKRKTRKSYYDKRKENNETKEPLIPTFLKQSEYNPFSSSEEEEFNINEKLFRNKSKNKSEKHKCRLVIALAKKEEVGDGVTNVTDIADNDTSALFNEENIESIVDIDNNTSSAIETPTTTTTPSPTTTATLSSRTSTTTLPPATTTKVIDDEESVYTEEEEENSYGYEYYSPSSSLSYS